MYCLVCRSDQVDHHSIHDGVDYGRCRACGSISADAAQLAARPQGERVYDEDYWRSELASARERSYGSSISRVAETLLYARIPVRNFVDIGSGPGYLLDALSTMLPQFSDRLWGVELFPPPEPHRSRHPNYVIGSVGDLKVPVSAGICVEVIEHLHPDILATMLGQLAAVSEPGALFFFNSGQPDFVDHEDPNYLDPFGRGHIISYSLAGLQPIFSRHGFSIFPLPGRTWAFLAEFRSTDRVPPDGEGLLSRLWSAHPDNLNMLRSSTYGPLLLTAGIEAARCYIEADRANLARSR